MDYGQGNGVLTMWILKFYNTMNPDRWTEEKAFESVSDAKYYYEKAIEDIAKRNFVFAIFVEEYRYIPYQVAINDVWYIA